MKEERTLNLKELLKKKSFFLFGPRSTGKSTLIKTQLADQMLYIDLLKSEYFLRLTASPNELREIISASKKELIVIDEVQKIPILLDEVHSLIEEQGVKFLLTGSSARKLKRENANMLGGRAWQANLYPLTSNEIKDFDLDKYLLYGGLPHVYHSEYPTEELEAYISVYLKEEIIAEGATRNLTRFSRFLNIAAISTSKIINFTKIANDVGSAPSTIIEYFRVLEDTLIGFFVEPLGSSKKRKEISSAKFYLFDTGVTNTLARIKTLERGSDLYGNSFEQFIAMELRSALSYHRNTSKLCYWRTYLDQEVDFVIEDCFAVEVKSSKRTTDDDAKSLKLFSEEKLVEKYFLVSQDPIERLKDNVQFIHYSSFLKKLWLGELWDR